jgi:hypothetical protein
MCAKYLLICAKLTEINGVDAEEIGSHWHQEWNCAHTHTEQTEIGSTLSLRSSPRRGETTCAHRSPLRDPTWGDSIGPRSEMALYFHVLPWSAETRTCCTCSLPLWAGSQAIETSLSLISTAIGKSSLLISGLFRNECIDPHTSRLSIRRNGAGDYIPARTFVAL